MGRDEAVRQAEQRVVPTPLAPLRGLLREIVERRAAKPSLAEGVVERGAVDDRSSGGVDEDRPTLHLADRLTVEETARLIRERRLNHDVIACLDQLLESHERRADTCRSRGVRVRVVGDELEAEHAPAIGDRAAEVAEPNDPET